MTFISILKDINKKIQISSNASIEYKKKTTYSNLLALRFINYFYLIITIIWNILEIFFLGIEHIKSNYTFQTNYPVIENISIYIIVFCIVYFLTTFPTNEKNIRLKHCIGEFLSTLIILFISSYYNLVSYLSYGHLNVYIVVLFVLSGILFYDLKKSLSIYFAGFIFYVILLVVNIPLSNSLPLEISLGGILTLLASFITSLKYAYSHDAFLEASIVKSQQKQLEHLNYQLSEANKNLERLSFLDELTGIPNRRVFNNMLDIEWKRTTRMENPLGLLIIDIDYFKQYNDNYGHKAGDKALQEVAITLAQSVKRPADLVVRYGGEEFAILLPETDQHGIERVAEKTIINISKLNIEHKFSVHKLLSVSIGGYSLVPKQDDSSDKFIENADKELYKAKENGRNQASIAK